MQLYAWHTNKPDFSSPGVVHQTLSYGTLDAIQKVKREIGLQKLQELFLRYPQKVYTASGLYFISKYILHIQRPFDERRYLKTTPRYTR